MKKKQSIDRSITLEDIDIFNLYKKVYIVVDSFHIYHLMRLLYYKYYVYLITGNYQHVPHSLHLPQQTHRFFVTFYYFIIIKI